VKEDKVALRTSTFFRFFGAASVLILSPWRDARRYFKIRQLSRGNGHPGNVPVGGSKGYPRARR
jgi:hypothetical protein